MHKNVSKTVTLGQTGLEAKILASALTSTSWPRPQAFGLSLASVLLTRPRKMCCPIQNNIDCIPFRGCIIESFSLQFCYLLIQTNYAVKLSERHSNVGINVAIKKLSYVLLALSLCVLFLFRNTSTCGLSLEELALASWFWLWPLPQFWPRP